MDFSWFFCEKYTVRRVMEARESWTSCFSCRSLLLSTTVLNDEVVDKRLGLWLKSALESKENDCDGMVLLL